MIYFHIYMCTLRVVAMPKSKKIYRYQAVKQKEQSKFKRQDYNMK